MNFIRKYYLLTLIILTQVYSCNWLTEKTNRSADKISETVNDYIVEPVQESIQGFVSEVVEEILSGEGIPIDCDSFRPDTILRIYESMDSLNDFGRRMIETYPDSIIQNVDKSFFIYDTADFMPLYFPYHLHYTGELINEYKLYLSYCEYSYYDKTNYSANIGDIDKLWVKNNWIAVRTYDSWNSIMSAEKLNVEYFLIDMRELLTYKCDSEKKLIELTKELTKEGDIQLLECKEFLEYYTSEETKEIKN